MQKQFVIPLATEAASAFRKLVQEHGGPEQFFERLSENAVEVVSEFMKNNRRPAQVLQESLANENYRRTIIESMGDDDNREFVEQFFISWNEWRVLYPRPYEIVRLLLTSLRDISLGPVPQVVNDVWDCDATVYLDTFREDLYVKSVMKLFQPNKELGGPDGWVTSSKLDSYLRTIHLMLIALSLRDSEVELIRIPAGKPIIGGILEVLEAMGKSIENLRKQFERMKSP